VTVVDLHPEELLDKGSRGELTDDERVRLEAHLFRCAACRAERVLRLDFAAELSEDDRPSAILGLVQGALRNAVGDARVLAARQEADVAAKESEDNVLRLAGIAPRRRPRRTAVMLLAAAAVLAAGAAGATGLTGRVWSQIRGNGQDPTHAEPAVVVPAPAMLGAAPAAVTEAPIDVPTERVKAVVAPPVVMTGAPAAPSVPSVMRTNLPVAAPAPVPSAAAPVGTVPASSSALASAASMFDAANAARRAGDTTTALALYDDLDRQFSGTPEARLAKATTGRLLLDQGDSGGALGRFDTYLRSGAPELREEAMAGRATALERLGRDDEESRAWAALLATYPETPYASHARARVARSLPR
jgi:hypothetical protein